MAHDNLVVSHSERLATLEKALCALREHTETRFIALEKAAGLAAMTMDKRLEAMNEIREAMRDVQSRQLTRAEFETIHQRDVEIIAELKARADRAEGKASQSAVNLATLLGVAGLIIGAISIILRLVGA